MTLLRYDSRQRTVVKIWLGRLILPQVRKVIGLGRVAGVSLEHASGHSLSCERQIEVLTLFFLVVKLTVQTNAGLAKLVNEGLGCYPLVVASYLKTKNPFLRKNYLMRQLSLTTVRLLCLCLDFV